MKKTRGFTLIEAIVVITIMGILSAMVAVFVRAPVQSYLDVVRRGVLSNAADIALRRMGRDLRMAVPNSVRVNAACGAASCFLEYLPIRDGGRYRAVSTLAGGGDILDFFTPADSSFDVLGPAVTGAAGDFLVVFNTGQLSAAGCATAPGGANAYEGCNRRTLSGAAGASVSFTATAQTLPFDSPGHRFQIVPSSGPITYACEGVGVNAAGTGTGTLRRYTSYSGAGIALAQPVPPAGVGMTSALLADGISACTITYAAGITAASGLVSIQLTLTQENESVSLYHEVHVDNQP